MNEIIYLIKQTRSTDEYGDPVISQSSRQVFCRVDSVGMKEFYQAASTGLKPELKFVLADYLEYQGEQLVEYDGAVYHVLRAYRKGLELELTCYSEVNPS